jgi:excisionase family DNA binding protein
MTKNYSTAEVAELLDLSWDTLHRWIRAGKVKPPRIQLIGRIRFRLWSEEDVAQVRDYKAKHYWGKGGRKKRNK